MHLSILSSWLVLLTFLIPIIFSGIIILRKTTSVAKIELILPAGIVLGLTVFTFLINVVAFILKGSAGIILSYGLMIFLGVLLFKHKDSEIRQIDFLEGKQLLFWVISIIFWGGLVYWKTSFALIGSDTNLYYAIAATFIKGNFPPQTPWQPDLTLVYHLGAFELLGSFHFFTRFSFEFLHLFFSWLLITCAIQIVIWIWGRMQSLVIFCLSNLIVGSIFISFGFFYLVFLNFPVTLPQIGSPQELVLWLRNLPTVGQAIEVYGAPVNLDSLIYFIFHGFGLAISLTILVIIIHTKQINKLLSWFVISVCLAALALINEAIFIATTASIIVGIVIIEARNHSLIKNAPQLVFIMFFLFLTVLFQGGIISASLLDKNELNESVVLFPKKDDIKEDFIMYHKGQQASKLLPREIKWLPFSWYHIGSDVLIITSFILIFWLRIEFQKKVILTVLFLSGVFSLLAYNFIVPKYLVANGNRFLALSFIYFTILLMGIVIDSLFKVFKYNKKIAKLALISLFLWITLPTILPPLAYLSKTRFGENKLIPKKEQSSAGIEWIRENIPYSQNVMVLDSKAPHPSGVARSLVQAGVFSPIFPGDFRAYTIEASPEYLDIAYTLSPLALKKLKISILLIDSDFYQTLSSKRQDQINNGEYFSNMFSDTHSLEGWEKVLKIQNEYLENGKELDGTLSELLRFLPKQAKIYIDNEENFKPSFIRRAIIFSLRDKNLYFLHQSGVYLNVEENINQKDPDVKIKYDYLVLGASSDPHESCGCSASLIWQGLNNQIALWKTSYSLTKSEYFGNGEK